MVVIAVVACGAVGAEGRQAGSGEEINGVRAKADGGKAAGEKGERTVSAREARALIAEGNAKFAVKEYAAATALYRKAGGAGGAEARFNEGCALLQAGKTMEAAERFRDADRVAGSVELSGRARFNLGQALFREGEGKKESAPEEAMKLLRESAGAFRSCLDAQPGDREAARNVEVVRRVLQQFQQKEQEKQQQQQGGQKQDQKQKDQEQRDQQQQADDLQKLADQQKRAAEESGKAGEQKDGADPQQMQRLQDQQEKLNQETKQAAEKMEQKESAASEKVQEAEAEQQKAAERLKEQDAKGAQEHQERAAERLREAAQEANEAADQQAKQNQEGKGDQGSKPDQEKKKEGEQAKGKGKEKKDEPKYDQQAAQLLDRERQQREARQKVLRAMRGRPQPVDKDW